MTPLSDTVIKKAEEYADSKHQRYLKFSVGGKQVHTNRWKEVYEAFLAGSAFSKPSEHNNEIEPKKPIYGYGNQEIESNQNHKVGEEGGL